MYCMRCGHPNDDTAKFCIKCGHSLSAARPRTTLTETAPVFDPAQRAYRVENTATPKPIPLQHVSLLADDVSTPRPIPRQDRPSRKTARRDPRPRTAWPYIAAVLSLLAGGVLAFVAYWQIDSGDTITAIVGFWNAFVTLGYLWLALRLVTRQEEAFKMGLDLSRANIWFVGGQLYFWSKVAEVTGLVALDEEFLASGFAFIITDLLLLGGIAMTRRDLLPPVQEQDVRDRSELISELGKATVSEAERRLLLEIRRRFAVYMSTKSWGGIEMVDWHESQPADLLARSVLAPARIRDDKDSARKKPSNWRARAFAFYPVLDLNRVRSARGAINCVIAITAPETVLRESEARRKKVGVYLLRSRVWAGKRSKGFEEFVKQQYGVTFHHWAA